MQVSGDVFDDDGDRIRLGIDRPKKFIVRDLLDRTLRHLFVVAKRSKSIRFVIFNEHDLPRTFDIGLVQVFSSGLQSREYVSREVFAVDEIDKTGRSHYTINGARHSRKDDDPAGRMHFFYEFFQNMNSACIDRRDVSHPQDYHLWLFRNDADRFLELADGPEEERTVNLEHLDALRNLDLRHVASLEFFVFLERVGDHGNVGFLRHILKEKECGQ